MLDGFIIEQIKRREEERETESGRPVLHLPLPPNADEDDVTDDGEILEIPDSARVIELEL